MDIIVTRPSPPYFGLFEGYNRVLGKNVSALLPHLSDHCEPYGRAMPTDAPHDRLVEPVLIADDSLSAGDCL